MKIRAAVFFGGRSPEHDVSVVTGLQALDALDGTLFEAFPVYVATDGTWFCGEALRRRSFYLPSAADRRSLLPVALDLNPEASGLGRLRPISGGGWFRRREMVFDVAIPAFHGSYGEDGCFQGIFEAAGVPYAGMRVGASAVLMHKAATRRMLSGSEIPQLPYAVADRPASGRTPDGEAIAALLSGGLSYPLIVKPMRLGSSIGVARVDDDEGLKAALAAIFRLDDQAIVEPCVEPLIEYNVAVAARDGEIVTSAIERPRSTAALLDFRAKYLSASGASGLKGCLKGEGKGSLGVKEGSQTAGATSEGMLSLTREIDPPLPPDLEARLRACAVTCYRMFEEAGAPRIDFLFNPKTGALWFNEVNPTPGSFAYFLWEAAARPLSFTGLLSHLVDEAMRCHRARFLPADPTHPEARLFARPDSH